MPEKNRSSLRVAMEAIPRFELSLEELADVTTAAGSPAAASSGTPLHRHTPSSHDQARIAGQNLFNAKSSAGLGGINRNLLLALGVTVLLFSAGAGYVWYIDSASNQPIYPVARPPVAAPIAQQPPAIAEAPKSNMHSSRTCPCKARQNQKAGACCTEGCNSTSAAADSRKRAAAHRATSG